MENKKRGRGRPKGSKNKKTLQKEKELQKQHQPTPTPIEVKDAPLKTELEELMEWAANNRTFFFNAGKKERKDIGRMYRLYNLLTGLNQQPGKCGACNGNIQLWLRKKLF